jgi:hypothetical protein
MASMPVSMAEPMAVPRAVVNVSMAVRSWSPSFVGGTISWAEPENATRPMRMSSGWDATKRAAACWATVSRLGSTSTAHIERDTSSARMMEVRPTGTVTRAWGRAAASARAPTAASSRPGARWRRQRERRGTTARSNATLE